MTYTHTFTGDDLDAEYRLVVTHNLNTKSVIPILMDNTDRQLNTADIFHLGDAGFNDKLNKCTIELAPGIPGSATYTLVLQYESSSETSAGRKAFELTSVDTITDADSRLILGKAGTSEYNITINNLANWLILNLSFLRKSNNLSDLINKASARANLGVYSTAQVDSALAGIANLLQSGSGAVLGVNNTATYTPSSQYNPATKGYVDTYAAPLAQGSVTVNDNVEQIYTLAFGKTLSDTNYFVEYSIKSNRSSPSESEIARDLSIVVFFDYTTTSVKAYIYGIFTGQTQNITLDWRVYKKY